MANRSSLDPTAAPFEPWNTTQIVTNNYNSNNPLYMRSLPIPNNSHNIYQYNHNHNPYYVPKLQQIQAASNSLPVPSSNSPSTPWRTTVVKIVKSIGNNKKDKIVYYKTLTVPIAKQGNTNIGKSQSSQPESMHTSNNSDDDVIGILIRGYCRIINIKIKFIPFELFGLFAEYYGNICNNKVIGIAKDKCGFAVADFRVSPLYNKHDTIYYTPITVVNTVSKIIATATNFKLPEHIIDYYNKTQPTQKLNKYSRFDTIFMQRPTSIEYKCIVFNDNFALELMFPLPPTNYVSGLGGIIRAVYSHKYGLLVSTEYGLYCFSSETWEWITLKTSSTRFIGVNTICLLERENKLFIYRWKYKNNPKSQCCLYDLNTSEFTDIPNSNKLQYPHPIIVCDQSVTPTIFAVVRNANRFENGHILYFDLNKFEWINTSFTYNPKCIQQIWFGNDKNIINTISNGKKCRKVWCKLDLDQMSWQQMRSKKNQIFGESFDIFKM